jgi:NAD(P)-dependent dehydrogenase (short-subunit alcohol dehydrogenase family)
VVTGVLVTGSTTGLGLGAARATIDDGHDVVLHARTSQRAADIAELAKVAAGVVIGDLADHDETLRLADQVDDLGPIDAVIHNAGVYAEPATAPNAQGHPRVLAVNVLAPYLLTALLPRPTRLSTSAATCTPAAAPPSMISTGRPAAGTAPRPTATASSTSPRSPSPSPPDGPPSTATLSNPVGSLRPA